jgi:hypothetical protein
MIRTTFKGKSFEALRGTFIGNNQQVAHVLNTVDKVEQRTAEGLRKLSCAHYIWRGILTSKCTLNYDTEELRCLLEKRSKEAFMDLFDFKCYRCSTIPAVCNEVNESTEVAFHFHHRRHFALYIGSFRILKDPKARRVCMRRLMLELKNVILLCIKCHKAVH